MVERGLATEGITVQPVTTMDVDEAVHVIQAGRCQAAFVDVFMYGDALGFSLVERLRGNAATRTLPIVVTSGARREIGRHVEFLQEHRCAVLLKPFDLGDIIARVQRRP
jgi:DNA-binding response OmpR family regulator